ncbi:MAG: cytidylate kinase family protein [Patescibacteria group bacterium]|nr:cytidylate kinase family protein [Patescibacteria group bacterium]
MTFEEALNMLKKRRVLRITVSGDIGSGKSTFAKRLAEELDMPRTYIGQIMRELAIERGVSLDELSAEFEKSDAGDRELDRIQQEKSREIKKGVFEGRVAWHFVEQPDVTLFLKVDPQVAAERVWQDKGNPLRDKYNSVEEIVAADEKRKQSEEARYNKFYGLSAYDLSNFDIVVDTTNLTIEEVFKNTIIRMGEFLQD